MSTALLNNEGIEKMREIIAMYVQDEENLRMSWVDILPINVLCILYGLASAHIIKKILKEEHPEIAEALSTRHKEHRMKNKIW